MNKINIVNLLLTRRCNLDCDYCAITKDYENKPSEYPDMKYYKMNEMSTERVIEFLRKLKLHNPDVFIVIYGGEPLLVMGLSDIINYCNKENINYTIISNLTPQLDKKLNYLFENTDYIQGLSASVDPAVVYDTKHSDSDRTNKSVKGYLKLIELKNNSKIKDLVAEVTVLKNEVKYLPRLIKMISDFGINSDITFVDIAKTPYYDFSNISDPEALVEKTQEVRDVINEIIDKKYNVHMRDTLLPMIYEILPSELDCGIEQDLHTICVDADGSIRLCLRIRGILTPKECNVENMFNDDYSISQRVRDLIKVDKNLLCKNCNHTCYIMPLLNDINGLVHSEIRKE